MVSFFNSNSSTVMFDGKIIYVLTLRSVGWWLGLTSMAAVSLRYQRFKLLPSCRLAVSRPSST